VRGACSALVYVSCASAWCGMLRAMCAEAVVACRAQCLCFPELTLPPKASTQGAAHQTVFAIMHSMGRLKQQSMGLQAGLCAVLCRLGVWLLPESGRAAAYL
jgi:hypothetical protein